MSGVPELECELMERRRTLGSEVEEMEKEWKLIADINFSDDTHSYTFENLDCTELYVEVQGLRNVSATESSTAKIKFLLY